MHILGGPLTNSLNPLQHITKLLPEPQIVDTDQILLPKLNYESLLDQRPALQICWPLRCVSAKNHMIGLGDYPQIL